LTSFPNIFSSKVRVLWKMMVAEKKLRFGEGKNNLKRGAEAVQNLNVAFLMNNRIVP